MALKGTERITTKWQDINPYKINEKELARLYTSLAKRLNQRMVRLERAGFTSESGGAYANYNVILKKFGYNKRIREKIKLDYSDRNVLYMQISSMRKQVQMMQNVLKAKSSTVPGWKSIIKKRREKLSEYGLEFKDTSEMSAFFQSYAFELISLLYSSEQAVEFVGKALRDGDTMSEIISKLEEFRDRTDIDRVDDVAKSLGFSGEAEALKYKYKG
jgi:hypothetical protein